MEQKLWALDLSLHYSDSLAMFQLMSYVSNGKLDIQTHEFHVPKPQQERRPRRRRLAGQAEEVNSQILYVKYSNFNCEAENFRLLFYAKTQLYHIDLHVSHNITLQLIDHVNDSNEDSVIFGMNN